LVRTPVDQPALEISGLTKHYRTGLLQKPTRPALKGLSLTVPRGEIFGYLGPNGSGKTTTLKVLMGLIFPDGGTATVLGYALAQPAWRHRVGYLPEHPYLYDYLTAAEYLDYAGRLFGMTAAARRERTAELLERVGLRRSKDVPLRRFSKGMLQRVGLAQALVNDPELVFLDEPMSGLDPFGRRLVRDVILELKARGRTVFFSTHILPDAEILCDRVALLRSGELLKVGRLDEILALDVAHMEVVVTGIDEGALQALPQGVSGRHRMGERWRLEVPEPALGAVVRAVEASGGRILSVQAVRESLEEYFFRHMAPDARGGPEGLEE
jgi:ABC-2 type transport system ATP-binding protein